MVPFYTILCTLSVVYYKEYLYLSSLYEFYESPVIASFFLLLCDSSSSGAQGLRDHFSTIAPKPWMQPIRFLVVHVGRNETGRAANGVKWFDAICFGVFRFCLVNALGAIMKWITEAADVYYLNSIIKILSLIAAILCLLQFYVATKDQLARHRPLLKFTAIKVVIFVFYVQKFIFSQLTKEGGVTKPSAKVSYPSWRVGVPIHYYVLKWLRFPFSISAHIHTTYTKIRISRMEV
ncbi:hypothetical protein RU639_001267 [Aspergillus parasiticus]